MRKKLAGGEVTFLRSGRARAPTSLHSVQKLSWCSTAIDVAPSSTQHAPELLWLSLIQCASFFFQTHILCLKHPPLPHQMDTPRILDQDKLNSHSTIKTLLSLVFGSNDLEFLGYMRLFLIIKQSGAVASPRVAFPNSAGVVREPDSAYDNCSGTLLVCHRVF